MPDLETLSIADQKRALHWQCRRGIKEIEILLLPFLENHYESQSAELRRAFVALLEESDLDMFEWFMHRQAPEDPNLQRIVNVIQERTQT